MALVCVALVSLTHYRMMDSTGSLSNSMDWLIAFVVCGIALTGLEALIALSLRRRPLHKEDKGKSDQQTRSTQ